MFNFTYLLTICSAWSRKSINKLKLNTILCRKTGIKALLWIISVRIFYACAELNIAPFSSVVGTSVLRSTCVIVLMTTKEEVTSLNIPAPSWSNVCKLALFCINIRKTSDVGTFPT